MSSGVSNLEEGWSDSAFSWSPPPHLTSSSSRPSDCALFLRSPFAPLPNGDHAPVLRQRDSRSDEMIKTRPIEWIGSLTLKLSPSARAASRALLRSAPALSQRFSSAEKLLEECVRRARPDGLFLEFGVGPGRSAEVIATAMSSRSVGSPLYGFDSFEGLPERWRLGIPKGAFRQLGTPHTALNVRLEVGLFQATLEPFLENHPEVVSFAHVDSDLYSSAHFVLSTLWRAERLRPGTVIDFDEIHGYPGWFRTGEWRALQEFCSEAGFRYDVVGIVPAGQQCAVALTR